MIKYIFLILQLHLLLNAECNVCLTVMQVSSSTLWCSYSSCLIFAVIKVQSSMGKSERGHACSTVKDQLLSSTTLFYIIIFPFNITNKVNITESAVRSKTAATAAKSFQSCLTLCDPIESSPPGSTIPRILQARTLVWVAISFSNA